MIGRIRQIWRKLLSHDKLKMVKVDAVGYKGEYTGRDKLIQNTRGLDTDMPEVQCGLHPAAHGWYPVWGECQFCRNGMANGLGPRPAWAPMDELRTKEGDRIHEAGRQHLIDRAQRGQDIAQGRDPDD